MSRIEWMYEVEFIFIGQVQRVNVDCFYEDSKRGNITIFEGSVRNVVKRV